MVKISTKVKDRILIGVNNRDPKWHDVHSLDLASGKLTWCSRTMATAASSPTNA
jgi:hypothetical protein